MSKVKTVVVSALASGIICASLSTIARAQTQTGSYDQMIAAYQMALQNPSLPPAMRQQIVNMLQQVTQSRNNMQSLGPNTVPNNNYQYNAPENNSPQDNQGNAQGNNENECPPYCSNSAQ